VSSAYLAFERAVEQTGTLAAELIEEQAAYAEQVAYVRDSGRATVERMRDIRLDDIAADTVQLVLGTLDFARPDGTVRDFELRRLLTTLARDPRVDANVPGEVQRLRDAVERIIVAKPAIAEKLEQLRRTPVPVAAETLRAAAESLYQSAVLRIDQARALLAVYAALLFLAVGFVAYRLHSSYREINRANANLAELNESLEHRVAERTRELQEALKNLKESQVQLVQAEKMSSLGQLVAGISHEINTPLLYLTNNAELLRERLELMNRFVK